MDSLVEAMKDFNESIKNLTKATNEVKSTTKLIDKALKAEIEEQKKTAEEVLNKIQF